MLLRRHKGAILTGSEIEKQVRKGRITIENFDPVRLGPNSYDICIGNIYRKYTLPESGIIDPKNPATIITKEDEIPPCGLVLMPNELYLVPTADRMGTDYYEPLVTGRSSIGRLGIMVHQEAGFGDIGFSGVWTLQIKVTYPTYIFPNMRMAQVYFLTPEGKIKTRYNGKYNHSSTAMASKIYEDFKLSSPRYGLLK